MLFNSWAFLLAFLPLTLAGYYALSACNQPRGAQAFLVAASLFFYGWWNPAYLWLILASIGFNHAVGHAIDRLDRDHHRRYLLILGITANLALLGWFKYANFFVDSLNAALGTSWVLERIVLPLAISFFTFQQISYLVDASRGRAREYGLLRYALFVTFFPQLIAGPIVRHSEIIHQFDRSPLRPGLAERLSRGLALFTLGLFKKVILADHLARIASPVFDQAAQGVHAGFLEAWLGTLAYTFQLYFDFSGYSDMAVGLGLMFGFQLPQNFNIPYLARSIGDFWRRWHMTLSRFLRDYLYIPLGGNRHGPTRTALALFTTLFLGGLWHGAGWTFILWGGLHGVALAIQASWPRIAVTHPALRLPGIISWGLTLLFVILAWVLFRSQDLRAAWDLYHSLFGLYGVSLERGGLTQLPYLPIAALLALVGPTAHEVCLQRLRPTKTWAVALGVVLVFLIVKVGSGGYTEFIYFQF